MNHELRASLIVGIPAILLGGAVTIWFDAVGTSESLWAVALMAIAGAGGALLGILATRD